MGWDSSKHPRVPAGTEKGGEFAPLDLWVDGIVGKEVAHTLIPNGSSAFQYALGRVTEDGAEAVFRRGAGERGTYGGWRWETDVAKMSSAQTADQTYWRKQASKHERMSKTMAEKFKLTREPRWKKSADTNANAAFNIRAKWGK